MAVTKRFMRKLRKREADRAYRKANAAALKLKAAERYKQDRPELIAKAKKHRQEKIEEIRAYDRARNKIRRQTMKAYYRAKTVERRNKVRVPKWANRKWLTEVYEIAKACGLQVDHIIPIQGDNVCGLHTDKNLQWLYPEQNRIKYNHFSNESYQEWRRKGENGPYLPD